MFLAILDEMIVVSARTKMGQTEAISTRVLVEGGCHVIPHSRGGRCCRIVFTQSVGGQELDPCSPVLSEKLLNKRIVANYTGYVAGEHLWACSASEQEIVNYLANADARNFNHDGAVGWGSILGIKGSWGSNSTNEFKSLAIQHWKDANCSESSRTMNYTAAGYFASQFLEPAAIGAWRDCELNLHLQNKLTCFAKPGQDDVVIVSNWFSTDATLPTINATDGFYAMIAGVKTQLPHANTLFIAPLETAIPRDPAKPVRVVLNATHQDRYNVSCSVYIPVEPSPPSSSVAPVPTVYPSTFMFGPEGKPRLGTNNTVWDAYCPAGTTVISGACISEAGALELQNFGDGASDNRWACAWTEPAKAATVHAMCAK